MKTSQAIGHIGVAFAISMLGGCAGAPNVSSVTRQSPTYGQQKGKGVFYALPRTELELQLEVAVEDVTPGKLSKYLKDCEQQPYPRLCAEEAQFAFKPVSAKSDMELCKSSDNGNVTVTRYYSLGDKTQINAVAVPDWTRLYFVDVTPQWYQKINASLQYSDNGLLSEMSAGGSNAVAEAGIKFATAVAGTFLASDPATGDPVGPRTDVPQPTSEEEKELRRAAVDELNRIKRRRDQILFSAPINGDASAILAALDARAAKVRGLYEGSVKTDSMTLIRRLSLRPDPAPGEEESIEAERFKPLETTMEKLPWIDRAYPIPGCVTDGKAQKAPVKVRVYLQTEKNSVEIALAQKQSAPIADSDQHGFRYRVPIPVKVTIHKADTTTFNDEDTRLVNKEFPLEIAQLGPTLMLPRKPGIFGGTIGAGFVGSTGRLKAFKTDANSDLGATIVNEIAAEATKDRKLEALENEEHELDLKAKIKTHKATLAGTPASE